jgi:hypothetical protein
MSHWADYFWKVFTHTHTHTHTHARTHARARAHTHTHTHKYVEKRSIITSHNKDRLHTVDTDVQWFKHSAKSTLFIKILSSLTAHKHESRKDDPHAEHIHTLKINLHVTTQHGRATCSLLIFLINQLSLCMVSAPNIFIEEITCPQSWPFRQWW